MKNLKDMDIDLRIEAKNRIKGNRNAIMFCYRNTNTRTPDDTITALVERIGYDAAIETVAELVNCVGEWDGRISRKVREWANSIETAANSEELEMCHVYSNEIHSAHVDQIACSMMKYIKSKGD